MNYAILISLLRYCGDAIIPPLPGLGGLLTGTCNIYKTSNLQSSSAIRHKFLHLASKTY